MSSNKANFTFVDLFAGIGGFHSALTQLGGRCVFASEMSPSSAAVYEASYGIRAYGDITRQTPSAIPAHDILAAGFPCQTFSKAGFQVGFRDRTRGTLFFDLLRVIDFHRPSVIALENVRNIAGHDGGVTWNIIRGSLRDLGYSLPLDPLVVSPHEIGHELGSPQMRSRVFMVARRNGPAVDAVSIPRSTTKDDWSLETWLSGIRSRSSSVRAASMRKIEQTVALMWGDFAASVDARLPGFPIWEPYMNTRISNRDLLLMPDWKRDFCEKNLSFYLANRRAIDRWRRRHALEDLPHSFRKFEWQAQSSLRDRPDDIFELLMQFRPSGLRVRRPTCTPALVAIGQTPILGWRRRRITTEEAAALQGFPPSVRLRHGSTEAYRQLGNAVHVGTVRSVISRAILGIAGAGLDEQLELSL
jgi:DNA (cytosine-5)-methyltransferase 1